MDEPRVEFGGRIERFSVVGDRVKVALTAIRKPGILDRLADLHEADSLVITIADAQQHLALHDGSDGHKYPKADGTGHPVTRDPDPPAPPPPAPAATGEQLRLDDPEPVPAGDGHVHLQGPAGEEIGSSTLRDEHGDLVESTARVTPDGSVQQTGCDAPFVLNRPPKPAERVTIGGVTRLLTGWARAMNAPLGATDHFLQWVARFHDVAPCEIDARPASERLNRDGVPPTDLTCADALRLLGACPVTWIGEPPSAASKKPSAAEDWLRRHYPEGGSVAEVARDLDIAPALAAQQLEAGREAGRLFAFAGRYIPTDRAEGITVTELSELLGELERWQRINGSGLTIQQVAERIHVRREVATDRLHAAMKAGLVRYDAGVYSVQAGAGQEAAV